MNTTTRRHPRSRSECGRMAVFSRDINGLRFKRTLAEAFPQDHAEPIERHPRPIAQRVADAIFAAALGVCGAALLVHFLAR